MPNDEYERALYIRALLNKKNVNYAQGGNLVNPAISDDVSDLAALDTSFNGVQPQAQPQQQKQQSGFDQFMNNVLGFVDEIAAKFGAGFVNGWEGILDFGATALGAMGWDAAADWAKQDIGATAAEWSKTAFGLGAWYNRLRNWDWNTEEWADIGKGFLDLNQAAFFAKNNLGNARDISDKHYKGNDEALQDMGQFGEFLGGAAHSIGFMLPSIMTAGGASAAGAGSLATQAVSLGTMGLGAAGKGSEEALNDGATSAQALGYGALTGAAEAASELVVGKALGLVGLGTGKIAGVVGKGSAKTTAKIGSKLFAKELAKTMFEEGMEEVSTAVLEPLFKSVYKGKDALKDYGSMDFWFGSDGHFNESVLGQFTSGAFVGGLSGGIQNGAVYRKVGADGYVALQNFQNLSEADAKMAKLEVQKKTDGKSYENATNSRTEAMQEFIESVDKLMKNGTEAQKKAFAEFLTNKNALAKWQKEEENLDKNVSDFVNKKIDLYKTHESAQIESFRNEMNRRFGTDFEYEIEHGDIKTDENGNKLTAYVKGNKIVINENVIKQKGGAKIAHEYMAHHLLKSLPSEIKSKLFRDVQNTEWYKNNKEEIDYLYGDETKAVYNEEAFAKYIEHVFEGDNVATQIENMRQVFGSKGLFSALERMMRGAKKFKSPELIKQYAKTLDKVTKAMIKSKIYSREELSSFIKQVDELKQLVEQPAYSKEVDSEGRKLTEAQVEFFKDSKIRDKNGNLLICYHGTIFDDFNIFDINRSSKGNNYGVGVYFSTNIADASEYGKPKGNGFYLNITNPITKQSKKMTRQQIDVLLSGYKLSDDSLYGDIKKFKKNIYKQIGNDLIIYEELSNNVEDKIAFIDKFIETTGYDGVKAYYEGFYELVAFKPNQIKNIDNKTPTSSDDIRYSKESGITGKYTVGDNNKPLEVRRKPNGSYEITFPSEGRTITEAQIKDEKGETKTIKFDSDTNVDEYLKDIKAKRVSREKSESAGKRVKGKKVEALDLTNSNIPTQEEMHKADATKLKRKYKIKNKTIYAGNDGKIEKVYKAKVQKDGSYKVQIKDLVSGNVETKIYSAKALLSELSSYTNVANTEKEVLETYKQAQESKTEQKQVEEAKEETKKTETKKKEVAKKQEKPTFKSVETSKDVVDQSVKYIENELGEGYKIFAPQNTETLVNRAFNAINDVKDVDLEARNLTNLLLQTNVEQLEDNGSYKEVGTLEDLLNKKQTKAVEKAIKQIIKSAPNTEARNNATKFLEMALNKVKNTAKQYKSESGRVRVLVRLRDKIRRNIQRFEEITNTNAEKYGLNVLLQPFEELHSGERTFKAKDFRINLNAALQWYTQENIENNYPELKYDDRIRRALVDVYESLGTPVERGGKMVYGQINADTMQKSIDAIRLIDKSIKEIVDNHVNKVLPAALQTIEAIKRSKYGKSKNVLSRIFRSYKRGFAPAYVVLEDIFGGNSEVARKLTFDFQNAVNSRTLYTGLYHDSINDKLKKLDIKKTLDSTKFTIRGHNITADQAMGLYIALNVEDNYNAIEADGAVGYDVNSKQYYDLAPKGNAEALKTEINSILPQQYKNLANWLLQTMNSEVKQDYIDWYKQEYGDYEARNEIGVLGDSSYWVLSRDTRKMSNLEKATYNPAAVFSRAKSRTNGNGHAVLISGALNTFDTYIEKLGSELFTKPVYREAQQMLNVKQKGGKSVYETISERDNGALDVKYVQDTMADMVGALQSNRDFLDKLIGSFSVAKLSLNIGSMMKQFASVWTSNIPLRKSTKAILSKMFNNEFKKEYKMLVEGIKKANGEWDLEPIGGLKYREASKGVLTANADSMFGVAKKVAKGGMLGISKMDLIAINTGVYSLMVIGQDQYNLKIGTRENAEFVKEHWTEFELSQIGSSALSKNYVSRGENVSRYIFGFLQGANRAALGSQLHKAGLWNRNRGVNETQLKNDLKVAKENTIKAEMAYNANPDSEQLRNEYIKAKATELDLENRLKDYQSYKIAGGGAIPVNMAAGILAQGIFITLINALMKWIKGRKDLDEYELAEESMNLAYAVFADWVPMVNALVNLFKGYEVSVPATNILNQFKDIVQSAKKGNFKSIAMDIAVLLGDMTGIPVETLYGYIYGTIKKFDPATAYEMNNILYGSSLQSASKTLNNYVDKNNVGKSAMMVGIIMEDYKTGSTNDKINREIAQLKIDGYNAMPSGVPEKVRDSKGAEIELDAKQIKQFKDYYSQSTKDVTNMLDITDYKKATAEERAKMLSKLYNAYYEYAKSRVGGAKPTNKLASILVATNGNVALAKYILSLEKISTITDTKKKTRKELVLQYVNKLRGFSKGEKAMLMYLAGYKVSGNSRNQLVSYLVKNGCKRKEAVKLVDGISD